jgi:GntR family transcriptional regulator / MocR family aminotransferase
VTKRASPLPVRAIAVDRDAAAPLYLQVYEGIRAAILAGELRRGYRLPSTRDIAREHGLSRNTVTTAFDQLLAEGYIEGRVGSGSYVAADVPDDLLGSRSARSARRDRGAPAPSGRGVTPTVERPSATRAAFRVSMPALDCFPLDVWNRLTMARLRRLPRALLGYGDAAGYAPLRRAIAAHLGAARSVRCEPEQVVIVEGAQQGLDLAVRLLLDPGDEAWIEDPGYLGARYVFLSNRVVPVPVPVDGNGLDPERGVEASSGTAGARLAYVTPSHQMPLGVTLSLARRLALLEWARRTSAWILEDDYDSEYRFTDRPLASLQGLDADGRVIYVGTFSKVVFPSLRIGYLVVPPELVDRFVEARADLGLHSPTIEQAVLADFIDGGHFGRHVRRMLSVYRERRDAFVEAVGSELGGALELGPTNAGIHTVGWLAPGIVDTAVERSAAQLGIDVTPLSYQSIRGPERPGLVLGYGGVRPAEMLECVRRLARAVVSSP